jgi:hypothetical protein
MLPEMIDARDASEEVGLVTCPNCRVAMRLVFIRPVEGESCLNEAAYRCPRCDAETRRWIVQ